MIRFSLILLLWAGLHSAIAAGLPAAEPTQNATEPHPSVVPLALDPTTTCSVLKPEGLQARGGYKRISGATFRCASRSKPLTSGGGKAHEIRFYATGTEDSIDLLGLELAVYSREDMQRSHRRMQQYAAKLTERTLNMALPTEVSNAILGGVVSSRWSVNHRVFTLFRKSLLPWGHKLEMIIR